MGLLSEKRERNLWYIALVNKYGIANEEVVSRKKEFIKIVLDSWIKKKEYSVRGAYRRIMSEFQSHSNTSWFRVWNKAILEKVDCFKIEYNPARMGDRS